MKNPLLKIFLFLVCVVMMSSCASKEDELVGSWGRIPHDDYSTSRVFYPDDQHPSYIQTITFKKEGGKKIFKDVIVPLAVIATGPNDGRISVGSSVSGEWEIKDNKLYLYPDMSEFKLINADNLSANDQDLLRNSMSDYYANNFMGLAKKGLAYKLEERNGKIVLHILFGKTEIILKKDEEK